MFSLCRFSHPLRQIVCAQRATTLQLTPHRLAGSSHWKNVKKTKEKKDAEKQRLILKHIQYVKTAVINGGGNNPKTNSMLASALKRAVAQSVPLSSLEKAMKGHDVTEPYMIEVRGKGNILILFESIAERVAKEKNDLQSIVKKAGFSVNRSTPFLNMFQHVGLVLVHPKSFPDEDAAIEVGLELGVEDVEAKFDERDNLIGYEFSCLPRDVMSVSHDLESRGCRVLEAEDRYLPSEIVYVTQMGSEIMQTMYDRVSSVMPGIQRHFDNVEVKSR